MPHRFTHDIQYHNDIMTIDAPNDDYRQRFVGEPMNRQGSPVVVVRNRDGEHFGISADTDTLSKYLGEKNCILMGQGVLVEYCAKNVWLVTWRYYTPVPVLYVDPHPTAAIVTPGR